MKHSTPKAKFSVNGGTSCFILPVSMGGVTIQAKYPVDVSTLSGEIAIRTECAGVIRFCLKGDTSKTVEIDCKGKKCPLPIVEISQIGLHGKAVPGDLVVCQADCPNFKDEIKIWADRVGKSILYLRDLGLGVSEVQLKW